MRRAMWIAGAVIVLVALGFVQLGFNQGQPAQSEDSKASPWPAPKPIPDEYIVVLKETAAKPVVKEGKPNPNREQKFQVNEQARKRNVAKVKEVHGKKGIQESAVKHVFADAIVGFSGKLTPSQAQSLRSDPDVEGVYQDAIIGIPLEPIQPIVLSTQTTTPAITMAGGPVDGSAKATWIWIVDTGVDYDHPDLRVLSAAPYARSFTGTATADDDNSHGTHCAGIAAAKNNTFGVVGVSAGAMVVPVKVLASNGYGQWSWIIAGLNHIAGYDMAGDVVSMSLGGYGYNPCTTAMPALWSAVYNLAAAGTRVVMAAGNDGNATGALRTLPGCFNYTNVFTVGSITSSKTCSSFSNWGAGTVDWAAVGSNVYSTVPGGGYGTKSGTSMATPVVSGIIHSKNGAPPASAGNVYCGGAYYPIARR